MTVELDRMVAAAQDDGVLIGEMGKHFGETSRQAGVAYAQLITSLRIADSLERIANAAERIVAGGSQDDGSVG